MRLFLYIFILFITVTTSCTDNKHDSLVIVKQLNDTIKINEIYEAHLFVPYSEAVAPSFFVINKDTFSIPFDADLKCGIYKAVFRKTGKKSIDGFVVFVDKTGKRQTEKFSLNVTVR